MKPASFAYARPASITEAIEMLANADGGGKAIAGGQSLGPMLNLRLVRPRLLVDIAGLPELVEVDAGPDRLSIGAAVTAANIEDAKIPTRSAPMLPRIARGIAYRAVRNRGTIGGSLCHADPAADWLCTLLALDASCRIVGAQGARSVPIGDFVRGAFETVLSSDELVVAVEIPAVSATARFGYTKFSRKTGKFPMASAAVLSDPDRDAFRAVIGATHGKPILVEDARHLLSGRGASVEDGGVTGLLTANGIGSPRDQHLYRVALRRAATEALAG